MACLWHQTNDTGSIFQLRLTWNVGVQGLEFRLQNPSTALTIAEAILWRWDLLCKFLTSFGLDKNPSSINTDGWSGDLRTANPADRRLLGSILPI